jgi:hypothetical protein
MKNFGGIMSGDLEIEFSPHDEQVKMKWRVSGNWSKPVLMASELLRTRSSEVRSTLSELNEYVRSNPRSEEERDPGWRQYRKILDKLKARGRALRHAIFHPTDAVGKATLNMIYGLKQGAALEVFCSDNDVTLPLSFVYDRAIEQQVQFLAPSLADFSGFWLSRFNISMYVDGGGCNQDGLSIDPTSLRTIFAMHEAELSNSVNDMGEYLEKLRKLFSIKAGDCYDWSSVEHAWYSINNNHNIVFIFAHSDGDWIELGGNAQLDCLTLADMLQKEDSSPTTLLILNCCLSVSGNEGASLLSVVARRGFCGMIGTEAKILNTFALCCGTHLMWEMCTRDCTLGDAFDAMQKDPKLFPLNLFYTCYANRNFRLKAPVAGLMESLP